VFNNPLKYTDPSGEFFLSFAYFFVTSHIAGVVDAIANGGINWHLSKARRQEAWTKADPKLSGTQANNYWKLTKGMFEWDHQRGGDNRALHNIWEVYSRFTLWNGLSSREGYIANNMFNLFGKIDQIDYYHGATVIFADNKMHPKLTNGGITMGNYIFINSKNPTYNTVAHDNILLMHEYGHYRQNLDLGPIAIPMQFNSLVSAGLGWASVSHGRTWWEQDANVRSYTYVRDYLTIPQEKAWRNDIYGRNMDWGGGKWWRYVLWYYQPAIMFFYNIHNSAN
jgi:hypothetical protein